MAEMTEEVDLTDTPRETETGTGAEREVIEVESGPETGTSKWTTMCSCSNFHLIPSPMRK